MIPSRNQPRSMSTNNENKNRMKTRSSKRTVSRVSSVNSEDLQGFDPEKDVFLEEHEVDGDWTEIKRRSSADEIRQAREVKRHSNEIITRVNPTLRLRPVRANTTCGNSSSRGSPSSGGFRSRTFSAPSPRCLNSVKSTAISLDLKKISLEWEKKRLNSIPEEEKKPKKRAHRLRALLSKLKSPRVLAPIVVVVLGTIANRLL
ncbi:Oidioi.mRNA.OKI2018_I69.XSR.g16538.t1.cds [Oikopleura dioica]|uniref:Oidioi.mRNA.OKI2018_I69.XSR.g16538.t1.cds n=1 Tax=Oikopleura dioica TaxID=34765 RepID=A0ABN7SLJ2_OIKDI|nr:Oidioi.mRNA.OKI2018_I69.XSR.g16538.t1.cds [Oikopleura dioica]